MRFILFFLSFIAFITSQAIAQNSYEGKNVLFVDSYNVDFEWSKEITETIEASFKDTGVNLKIIHWDSKNNSQEEFILNKANETKSIIEEWKPDVVICADDNASKYLIVPFYKDSDIPFVFCGVNWSAERYGFPCENVTGMIEVSPIPGLIKNLSKYSKGAKIGYLALDNESNRIDGERFKDMLGEKIQEKYIKNFEEWKNEYLNMQSDVDMLIIGHNGGILDWDDKEAKIFVVKNSKIPSGATIENMSPFVLLNFAKVASEQGEFAAKTAKQILSGVSPRDIPIEKNKKGNIVLNLYLAKLMNIAFKIEDLNLARKMGGFVKEDEYL